MPLAVATKIVQWFDDIRLSDIQHVGGKNAALGEMIHGLKSQGIRIPNGFAITADAYRQYLHETGLAPQIAQILSSLNEGSVDNLQHCGMQIRHLIMSTPLPEHLAHAIVDAYHQLSQGRGLLSVAVRSSATAEDLPDASFAGQQETYLNVSGQAFLLDACHRCFASLFTDRAISYRMERGYEHMRVALSIGVQEMVRSDLGAAGVMFTLDTETGFPNVIVINAAYGLGENVVQGCVDPDEYRVFKLTLDDGFRPILKKTLGSKAIKMVYDVGGNKLTKNELVRPHERALFALTDDEILVLAKWAVAIERYFEELKQSRCPMDIEWARDGRTGELFILQARPETVQSRKSVESYSQYRLKSTGEVLARGKAIGDKIVSGRVQTIMHVDQLKDFHAGNILVTDKTDPDWEPIMKYAAGIITNRGGRTCHAAIVSRELGLPAVIGTQSGTDVLRDGQEVTISCAQGEEGLVYAGTLPFEVFKIPLTDLRRPKTEIMMNVGTPDEAFGLAAIPCDGIGLTREEFIISNYVKVHPRALLEYDRLDASTKSQVDEVVGAQADRKQFYIDRLAEGIGMIAAAFYPRPVILRLSDFKSNEYANLIGGSGFEPREENPMIGFRGASRYYAPEFRDAFGLECLAIQKVRQTLGLKNLKLMIPFCRTVEEARQVQAEMARYDLVRGQDGLELYVMCEIPANVILADKFCEVFDGFSIGSNDLTQLTLGVDRDSEIVAHVFDERNLAVKRLISSVIKTAKAQGVKIGICGQAPSDYPDFCEFLVREGIDSISLSPDSVIRTTVAVLNVEDQLAREAH